jgi:hypothetical protein
MEYVMVPVPEELVVDVMQHVARLVARASVVPWTDEAVQQHFDDIDEAGRSLMSLVARATVAGKDLSDEDAADALELSVREARAIMREVNDVALREGREPLLALRETMVTLRNGRTVSKQIFTMAEPVARMVRAHERASLPDQTLPDQATMPTAQPD